MDKTIKFTKGDSYAGYVTIDDINQALDAAFFTIKENSDDKPLIQKKLGAGISLADNRLYKQQLSYKFQLDGFDTVNLEIGTRYLYDFKGLIGNVQKTLLSGELILSATQTGYITPSEVGGDTPVEETFNATLSIGAQSQYIETEVDPVACAKIGDMTKLDTTEKETIVGAINEVKKGVDNVGTPTFTEATAQENIESGETQPTLWGKVKKWFSSLKALAFKDKVGTNDFEADAKCPQAVKANSSFSATNATNAKVLTGQIDWTTTNNSGIIVSHTLEPVEIFGEGYTAQKPFAIEKAPLNGYDCTKGSIEERLSSLGFNQGTITYGGKRYSSETPYADGSNSGGIWKQGKIVWCQVIDSFEFKSGPIKFEILEKDKFLPVADVYFSVNWYFGGTNFFVYYKLSDSGTIEQLEDGAAGNPPPVGTTVQVSFNFGYMTAN